MFGNLVHSLLHPRSGSRRRGQEEATAKRPLKLEMLEDRRLLAVLEFVPDQGNDTHLFIELNEQGAFGYSDDLAVRNGDFPDNNAVNSGHYDPVGGLDLAGTTFASGIAIGFGNYNGGGLAPEVENVTQRHFLTSGYIGGRGTDNGSGNNISGQFDDETNEPDVLISEFFYPNSAQNESEAILKFRLVQSLIPLETQGAPSGVVLDQTYTIQNVSGEELNFDIIRYMDADLFAFPPDEPGLPDTEPALNGGGVRNDSTFLGIASVFTSQQATNTLPFNDPSIVTIRGNPDDTLGIPPGEVNRWELGRGSVWFTPDHNCNAATQGFVTLRAVPDNCLTGWITPAPWWKVLHHDFWRTAFSQNQPPTSYDPAPGRDQPDALPLAGTTLRTIVDGDPLADGVTNPQTVAGRPATPNPDDDGNDQVDVGDEYDVAMALRNVYTRVRPSQQFEYFTQTVFGSPPVGVFQYGNLAGTVYDDRNGNGTRDGSEPGVEGQRIFIDQDPFNGVYDANEQSTVTDANGVYLMRNVIAGTQSVGVEADPDYRQTEPDPTVDPMITAFVPAGSTSAGNDFGLQFLGGYVEGTKFMDLNGNGIQNPPFDEGLGDWVIFADEFPYNGLSDQGEEAVVTDATTGFYSLALLPGTYRIREVNQANWTQTTPPSATNPNDYFAYTIAAPAVGSPNQQEFNNNFGNDPAPFTISGVVWEDEFPNGVRDSFEGGMPNVQVYIDVVEDGVYNAISDRGLTTLSAADGSWSISSGDVLGPGTYKVREVVQPTFDKTFPSCCHSVTANPADAITGINFGNRFKRAQVTGLVWNNPNGNAIQDPGEPGMGGVFVYIDQNNDGSRGLTEPGAVTNADGTYRITEIRPGGPYTIRQEGAALANQNFPAGGAGYTVTLAPNEVRPNINFGNLAPKDYGDAPDSYSTTIAASGAVHGILSGYSLGAAIDGEVNGVPTTLANGDDLNAIVDDEDGVTFLTALQPGQPASINVTFTQNGTLLFRPPQGFVQGWIDFNRNGTFADPGEQILVNRTLARGSNPINFTVPAGAVAGPTYARFRLGLETSLGFSGPSTAGEVEDYRVLIGATAAGTDQIGVRRGNRFLLDYDGNGTWTPGVDRVYAFGLVSDTPLVGDWNGDGIDEIGVRRGNRFLLDYDGNGTWTPGVDRVYAFGLVSDTPLAGDWNGDGIDEIGVRRGNRFLLDYDGNGTWTPGVDRVYTFGLASDTPLAGDWNGDGIDEIGVRRGNRFLLDFNGNGQWTPGVDRVYPFGLNSDTSLAGDWNGDGIDEIGVRRGSQFLLDFNGNGQWTAGVDRVYSFGVPSDTPLIGNWALPLMAAGGLAQPDSPVPVLTRDELAPLVQYAADVWLKAPLTAEQERTLSEIQVQIADLAGARVGQASGTTIVLDIDAAGYGWFVDATPWDDVEFDVPRSASPSPHSIDLLTAVMHEIGHVLGYGHDEGGVMQEELAAGVRPMWADTVDTLFTGAGGG